ncbi:uncharacterized protein EV154DRAFT_57470 [Mucor mucedo]|uniref:uncharacterized protein n=1 Tax=Mucor mucedo TaxID=29922 RepID=UPI00221E6387|nr:uncharacterized protein EV154DRAFT_57470 [Mucor mucedo]KAI7894782.1 hypothetical protein EV154DRAFT_57470 [Mucor mucedo]
MQTDFRHLLMSSFIFELGFKLAQDLILVSQKIMDITKAETLVMDAERNFFNNATSGNMNAGSMKQAWDCLKILPAMTEIQKTFVLINSIRLLIRIYLPLCFKAGRQLNSLRSSGLFSNWALSKYLNLFSCKN